MRVCKSCVIFFFSAVLLTVQDLKSQPASFITIEGNGSPVVMLQGGASPLSLFDRHAKELSASYKVIRIERLNVSCVTNNTIIPANYSVRMESERLDHLLDSLNINEPVVLIGLSYGGLIALDFALNHMARIRSLILIEPPAFWIAKQKGEHPAGMDEMVSITKDFTPDAVITEQQMERFRCTLANCTNTSLRDNAQWNTWVKNIPLLKGLSAVAQHDDSIQRLLSFHRPVMIVTGNQTAVFHKRINELLFSLLPDASSLILEGSHAACTSNAYNEFMSAAKEFMVNRSR